MKLNHPKRSYLNNTETNNRTCSFITSIIHNNITMKAIEAKFKIGVNMNCSWTSIEFKLSLGILLFLQTCVVKINITHTSIKALQ